MATPYPDHPQLRGNFAPIRMESDIHDIVVRGEIPRDLDVTYFRNGPDPQFAPRGAHHWFGGDGMLHRFRIHDGRVSYRNRWVQTVKWKLEREAGEALFNFFGEPDPRVRGVETDGAANTNIVWHGGKLLALEEGHAPFQIDPVTLNSMGPWRFDDKYAGPMTAHPKIDPDTGEMMFFGYMVDRPLGSGMSYQTVNAAGELTRSERFDAPFPSMVHDFITTDAHAIFPIFPLTGSMERAMRGQPPLAWEPEKGSHVGVMPRSGSVDDMRWFETDPCFVFHPMNAYDDGDKIVAHVMQFEEAPLFPKADGSATDPKKANARLCEWVIDPGANSNEIQTRYLDDITGEFPRLDERRAGKRYRHGYYAAASSRDGGLGFDAIVHHDFEQDARALYALPGDDSTGEPVFVPRSPDADEGDGYLIAVVYRAQDNRSDLAIFDATDVTQGPIACAELPHRVPYGFHGNWMYND